MTSQVFQMARIWSLRKPLMVDLICGKTFTCGVRGGFLSRKGAAAAAASWHSGRQGGRRGKGRLWVLDTHHFHDGSVFVWQQHGNDRDNKKLLVLCCFVWGAGPAGFQPEQ